MTTANVIFRILLMAGSFREIIHSPEDANCVPTARLSDDMRPPDPPNDALVDRAG